MSALKPPPRVLIIRPGALGDTLLMLPALAELGPGIHVTFVGRRPGIDFLRGHAARVLDMEGAGWHRLFSGEPGPGPLPVSDADAVVAFLVDETVRKNLERSFPKKPVHLFPALPEPGKPIHVALHVARALAAAGLPLDPDRALKRTESHALLGPPQTGEKGPFTGPVILHPGSGSRRKNLPWPFWRNLSAALSQRPETPGLPVVFLLGPAEEELLPLVRQSPPGPGAQFVVEPDAPALSRLLREAALFVGHDSGVTHLAALHGTPTLALFRDSDTVQWHPLGPRVRVLQDARPHAAFVEKALQATMVLLE